MYDPPIQVHIQSEVGHIADEMKQAQENAVLATVKLYVDVDKEELEKALRYDREQYEKGFADGVASRKEPMRVLYKCGIGAVCPRCDGELYPLVNRKRIEEKTPFCKHCGQAIEY